MDSQQGGLTVNTLGELLDELYEEMRRPLKRYPIVRSGPRDPIPSIVRLSVYRRDGFRCRECGIGGDDVSLELDHCLPWSAGGGDHSANLRALCHDCNQRRSNWNDRGHEINLRPTTWWCWFCWRHPDFDGDWVSDDPDVPTRGYRAVWKTGVDLAAAPYVTGYGEQVYCAWCQGYGYSDVWFSSPERQDSLAAMCQIGGVA